MQLMKHVLGYLCPFLLSTLLYALLDQRPHLNRKLRYGIKNYVYSHERVLFTT